MSAAYIAAQFQTFGIYRGEDVDIELTGPAGEDPSGYSLLATVKEYPESGTSLISTTSVGVEDMGNDVWKLTISLTRAETSALAKCSYVGDLWNTSSGGNVRLAGFTLSVLTPVRNPA